MPAKEKEKCRLPGGSEAISSAVTFLSSTVMSSSATGGGVSDEDRARGLREHDATSCCKSPAFRRRASHAAGYPGVKVSTGGRTVRGAIRRDGNINFLVCAKAIEVSDRSAKNSAVRQYPQRAGTILKQRV